MLERIIHNETCSCNEQMRMVCVNFANNKYLLNASASGDLTNEK